MDKLTYEQAKDKALSILAFGSNTAFDLRRKLKAKGADNEVIDRVIDFCKEYGFIDDRDYAVRKAMDLFNLKKYGKSRIAIELRKKGISENDIENALESIDFPDEVPYELLEKKINNDFSKKNLDRAVRYFVTRGYNINQIKRGIERITENEL